jgi:hypothetical protein
LPVGALQVDRADHCRWHFPLHEVFHDACLHQGQEPVNVRFGLKRYDDT